MNNIFYVNGIRVEITPDVMDVILWINREWYVRIDPFGEVDFTNLNEYVYKNGEIYIPKFDLSVKFDEEDRLIITSGKEAKTTRVYTMSY